MCDALHDLIPFVQFKNNYSLNMKNTHGELLLLVKATLFHECFLDF